MKRLALSLVMMCVVALPAMGQVQRVTIAAAVSPTASPVGNAQSKSINLNSSRSNIYKIVVDRPTGTLHCTADGKPCTQDQAKALAAALGKQSPIKSLTLANDGSLLCNGTHCTAAHIPDLDSAAHAIQMMRKSGGDPQSSAPQY
jgi:hypothetical protein